MKDFIYSTHEILAQVKVATAATLMLAMFLWATGLPAWLPFVQAAALVDISDTLSDSDLSATSDHAWAFTTVAALDQNDTMVFTLDPDSSGFTIGLLAVTDVTAESGLNVVAACGGGTDELTMATTTTTITLTVCAGDTITAGAKALTFDNARITNPGSAGSRVMRVRTTNDGATTRDTADTRVAIIDDVTVTASVNTIFIFTVAGIAANSTINGDTATTSTTTSATAIGFETLYPNIAEVGAQTLTVETNAAGGFTVTVVQDQVLTSATGATIDNFINGANTASSSNWQAPAGTLGSFNTYGHFGVTSEDDTLSGSGQIFGTALYAGNINTPREIFYHDGPADGSTADIGLTRVGYKIEIDSLQEAASDYTMQLTYVATPIF
jgi:hypothetical protein